MPSRSALRQGGAPSKPPCNGLETAVSCFAAVAGVRDPGHKLPSTPPYSRIVENDICRGAFHFKVGAQLLDLSGLFFQARIKPTNFVLLARDCPLELSLLLRNSSLLLRNGGL